MTYKLAFAIAISVLVGVWIGQWSIERQMTKQYEDGSFVGCYRGGDCND